MDPEIQEGSTDWECRSSGARPGEPDRCGARVGDYFWEGRTRPRSRLSKLSPDTEGEPDYAVVEGDEFEDVTAGVWEFAEKFLGQALIGEGCLVRIDPHENLMQSRVMVTGASGFVGRVLCNALASNGCQVVGLGRSGVTGFYNGVYYRTCDLRTDDLTSMKSGGFGAVVHLAGLAHGKSGKQALDLGFHGINVDATLRVAEVAILAGINRFVFISSIGVHGVSTSGAPITESSPMAPDSPYAQSKLDAEIGLSALFKRHKSSGLVIVRPPLVYGAEAPGNFRKLLRLAALPCPLPFGACDNRRSMISISNLVAFLMLCVDHPQAAGQVFVVSDGNAVSTRQIVSSLRRGMKRRSLLLPAPALVMKAVLTMAGKREIYQQLFGDLEVDSRKAERLLGWLPDRDTLKQLETVGASYADSRV